MNTDQFNVRILKKYNRLSCFFKQVCWKDFIKSNSITLAVLLLVVIFCLQSACGVKVTPTPVEIQETLAEPGHLLPDGVILLPNVGGVGVGEQLTLQLYDHLLYFDQNPYDSISWISSDAAIASVDSSGGVTGNAIGTVKITAKVQGENGDEFIFTSTIKVGAPVNSTTAIIGTNDAASMNLPMYISIPCYCSETIWIETKDASGTLLEDRPVLWSSQAPDRVSIDRADEIDDSFLLKPYETENILRKIDKRFFRHTATVVGHEAGSTTITAESEGVTINFDVEISENEITVLKITPESMDIAVNQTQPAMAVGYTDEQCRVDQLDVKWSIEDTTIATINPSTGVVNGLAVGMTTLNASYANNQTASIVVKVHEAN
jgi:uncharacterized protein YjdB